MKHRNFLVLIALAILSLFSTSCEKDDTKPATTNGNSATVSGTFTVNGAAQTPTRATRGVITETSSQKTYTQTTVQNDKYVLQIDFSNATMASGDYKITQEFLTGNRNANITFRDLATGKATLIVDIDKRVTVSGDRITIPALSFNFDGKDVTLSGDYTVKSN